MLLLGSHMGLRCRKRGCAHAIPHPPPPSGRWMPPRKKVSLPTYGLAFPGLLGHVFRPAFLVFFPSGPVGG